MDRWGSSARENRAEPRPRRACPNTPRTDSGTSASITSVQTTTPHTVHIYICLKRHLCFCFCHGWYTGQYAPTAIDGSPTAVFIAETVCFCLSYVRIACTFDTCPSLRRCDRCIRGGIIDTDTASGRDRAKWGKTNVQARLASAKAERSRGCCITGIASSSIAVVIKHACSRVSTARISRSARFWLTRHHRSTRRPDQPRSWQAIVKAGAKDGSGQSGP